MDKNKLIEPMAQAMANRRNNMFPGISTGATWQAYAEDAEAALIALCKELPYPTYRTQSILPNGSSIHQSGNTQGLACIAVGNGEELYNQFKEIGKDKL